MNSIPCSLNNMNTVKEFAMKKIISLVIMTTLVLLAMSLNVSAADNNFSDIDGLVTNVPGITLVTSYADCVPLYMVDPVKHAIGLSHSGWRGTVNRMGQETLRVMAREFGTDPKDVTACVGPSICQDCYEVGPEVIEQFAKAFDEKHHDRLFYEKPNGKYQLNLWEANFYFLIAGLQKSAEISVHS